MEIVQDKSDFDLMSEALSEYVGLEKSREVDRGKHPTFNHYFADKHPGAAQRLAELDRQYEIEREEQARWEPSEKEVAAVIAEKGWPTFDQITFDHIDDEAERQKLETAVQTVKDFVKEIKSGAHGLSLIMVANPVDGDMDRTGYGCGKTTLAQAAYYANVRYTYAHGMPDSLQVYPVGRFYSAREIMALFDAENFSERYTFQNLGKVVIIDDLGREGTLKWEKRDLDMQLQEKQDRYYSLINHCYENGISMIVTSNLTSREMATFLGGASWSRLLQMVPKRYRINMTGIRDMRPLLAENDWF